MIRFPLGIAGYLAIFRLGKRPEQTNCKAKIPTQAQQRGLNGPPATRAVSLFPIYSSSM